MGWFVCYTTDAFIISFELWEAIVTFPDSLNPAHALLGGQVV